jgi:hypothetical protein
MFFSISKENFLQGSPTPIQGPDAFNQRRGIGAGARGQGRFPG